MPLRRDALKSVITPIAMGVAGCSLNNENQTNRDKQDTSQSLSESTGTSATHTTTPKDSNGTSYTTNTCEEQAIQPDIYIINEQSSEVTVSVEVEATPAVPDPPFFTGEYTVEERKEIDDRIYTNANPDRYEYQLKATVGNKTDSIDVTQEARQPDLRGTDVQVLDDDLRLVPALRDPGEYYNPNCYG